MSGFETVFPGGRQLHQAALDRMSGEELRAVRDEALARFNADLDGPHSEYLEVLGGAASDLLLARKAKAGK